MAYLDVLPEQDGHRRYRMTSPTDGADLGVLTVTTPDEVRAAVARARAAQPAWEATPLKERVAIVLKAVELLRKRADAYMALMRAETGRADLDTLMIELFAGLDSMNYYARNAHKVLSDQSVGLHLLRVKKAKVVYRPLGVCGVISPWNGPFILSLNPSVQALLAGNTVVLKPSEYTPTSGGLAVELLRDAGVPAHVFQVVQGDGETGAALVDADVDKIGFTGSVRTGRKIGESCGRRLIPCTLELGGKDPMLVFADANLERAVGGAVFGSMMNAGQFCAGTERVYVERKIADEFTRRVVARVSELQVGRDIGPFIAPIQQQIVATQVDEAVAAGATVLVGGKTVDNAYAPTVLTGVTHDMALMREETFGPILPIMVFDTEEEALRLANDCQYGLGASVWTGDAARADRLARKLAAGSVTVNETSVTYGAVEVPFGGRKASGVGRVNGADALRSWSHALPILSDRFVRDDEPVWYPYTPDKAEKLRKGIDWMWGTPIRWFLS